MFTRSARNAVFIAFGHNRFYTRPVNYVSPLLRWHAAHTRTFREIEFENWIDWD